MQKCPKASCCVCVAFDFLRALIWLHVLVISHATSSSDFSSRLSHFQTLLLRRKAANCNITFSISLLSALLIPVRSHRRLTKMSSITSTDTTPRPQPYGQALNPPSSLFSPACSSPLSTISSPSTPTTVRLEMDRAEDAIRAMRAGVPSIMMEDLPSESESDWSLAPPQPPFRRSRQQANQRGNATSAVASRIHLSPSGPSHPIISRVGGRREPASRSGNHTRDSTDSDQGRSPSTDRTISEVWDMRPDPARHTGRASAQQHVRSASPDVLMAAQILMDISDSDQPGHILPSRPRQPLRQGPIGASVSRTPRRQTRILATPTSASRSLARRSDIRGPETPRRQNHGMYSTQAEPDDFHV